MKWRGRDYRARTHTQNERPHETPHPTLLGLFTIYDASVLLLKLLDYDTTHAPMAMHVQRFLGVSFFVVHLFFFFFLSLLSSPLILNLMYCMIVRLDTL